MPASTSTKSTSTTRRCTSPLPSASARSARLARRSSVTTATSSECALVTPATTQLVPLVLVESPSPPAANLHKRSRQSGSTSEHLAKAVKKASITRPRASKAAKPAGAFTSSDLQDVEIATVDSNSDSSAEFSSSSSTSTASRPKKRLPRKAAPQLGQFEATSMRSRTTSAMQTKATSPTSPTAASAAHAEVAAILAAFASSPRTSPTPPLHPPKRVGDPFEGGDEDWFGQVSTVVRLEVKLKANAKSPVTPRYSGKTTTFASSRKRLPLTSSASPSPEPFSSSDEEPTTSDSETTADSSSESDSTVAYTTTNGSTYFLEGDKQSLADVQVMLNQCAKVGSIKAIQWLNGEFDSIPSGSTVTLARTAFSSSPSSFSRFFDVCSSTFIFSA
ncbi:hypothetical protein JCM8547_001855 [Rhodosporidiobolus lusitaniae]